MPRGAARRRKVAATSRRRLHLSKMLSSALAAAVMAFFSNYFHLQLRGLIERYAQKLIRFFNPYIEITVPEQPGNGGIPFAAIRRYLNANANSARCLQADASPHSEALVLTMANHEEVTDEFESVKLWWASGETIRHKGAGEPQRFFRLTFHRKHRDTVCSRYLKHVLDQGKAITRRERQRKLYSNGYRGWSSVVLEHPTTFDTLAMDPHEKQEIIDDLVNFSESREYYAKIGKAWKRGYLLHGPPGTGKSTLIAAMAHLLAYDIYDLELTAVRDNTELRKLLIETSSKSLIVIEDIDCSLDLTGKRPRNKENTKEEKKPIPQVTLSGLLNFIDGLWSACGGERIIVFTTNYVDKLDPALIRRGRMDKHIKMSYCGFQAFKVLAKNYLDIDSHHLFNTIRRLLEETNMSPADVTENLMPKSRGEDKERCLERLVKALEEEKPKAEKMAKEEEEEGKKVNNGDSQDLANRVKQNGEGINNLEIGMKQNGDATR